jgi:hypothetical protein
MSDHGQLLDVVVRGWPGKPTIKDKDRKPYQLPRLAIVIDTETLTDVSQRLNFGCSRTYAIDWTSGAPQLACLDETLIYADDLAGRDRDGYRVLADYVAAAGPGAIDPTPRSSLHMRLLPRLSYSRKLYRATYNARAQVVGFNLNFDISRLAFDWTDARGSYINGYSFLVFPRGDATPGKHAWRPNWCSKSINSKMSFMGYTSPMEIDDPDRIPPGSKDGQPDDEYVWPGDFLDLRTLTYALTDRGHTLESACAAFGVDYIKRDVTHGTIYPEYIDYCREDVTATAELYVAAMSEFLRHPIGRSSEFLERSPGLPASQAWSSAKIGKEYLKAFGIRPPLERNPDIPDEILGLWMASYFGGRVNSNICRLAVPLVYVDFASMYATVCSLLGVWGMLCAERIESVAANADETAELQGWLDSLTIDKLLRPRTWSKWLCGLVEIVPDGDVLPVRGPFEPGKPDRIAVGNFCSTDPYSYAIPDVAAATILSGKAPRIRRYQRLVHRRRARGLAAVKLRGEVLVDPRRGEDFFRAIVEQRKLIKQDKTIPAAERDALQKFLKTLVLATSYGIYAQMDPVERPDQEELSPHVWGLWDFDSDPVNRPECPGEFCFPPIASLITSSARLLLSMLERLVTDKGGCQALEDTDSMAIVATEQGGLVPCPGGPHKLPDGREAVLALSWAQVDEIRQRLNKLNPYDRTAVPDLLELEDENFELLRPGSSDVDRSQRRQIYCYSISPKRYELHNLDTDGRPIIRRASEHALGYLLNPTDPDSTDHSWIERFWHHVICLGLDVPDEEPKWLDRIVCRRSAITKPSILHAFDGLNQGRPREQQVRPYNFLLTCTPSLKAGGRPDGDEPFCLIAPYSSKPHEWPTLPWVEIHTHKRYHPATTYEALGGIGPGAILAKTYREVLGEFTTHTNPKLLGPDGLPGHSKTVGLMRRRQIHSDHDHTTHGGKEVPMRETIRDDLLTELDEDKAIVYRDKSRSSLHRLVLPALRSFRPGVVAKRSGLPLRSIKRWRSSRGVRPRETAISKLTATLISLAREALARESIGVEREQRMHKFESRPGLKQRPDDMRGVLEDYLKLAARTADRPSGSAPLTDDERAVLQAHRHEAQQLPGLNRDTLRRAIDGKALRPNTRDACRRAIKKLADPG